MSGIGLQLRPPVVDVHDTAAIWQYLLLPDHVRCSGRTAAAAAAQEDGSADDPDTARLSGLKAYDNVMHALRRLASVATSNLTEPNEPTHQVPRCCDTHRARNAEDKRRIRHKFYPSKLLKLLRAMAHMQCDENGVHVTRGSDEPCLCQHCILVRYRTGKLRTRRGAQQLSFWSTGRMCWCKVCREWLATNPHHPVLRDPFRLLTGPVWC